MDEHTIGQRITRKRKELGLSQADLGDRLGVSRQAISKWEGDAAIPDVDKLIALSKLFDVSVGWLLGVEDFDKHGGDVDGQDDPPFTARERELLELLSRPRPMPRWAKWCLGGVAGVLALCLLVNTISSLSSRRQAEEYLKATQQQMKEFLLQSNSLLQQGQTILDAGGLGLSEYRFEIYPWPGSTGCVAELYAVPTLFSQDMAALFQVECDGEVTDRVMCDWDGHTLTASVRLEARDGYILRLILTEPDQEPVELLLSDPLAQNPATHSEFGAVGLEIGSWSYENQTLTLENVHITAALPRIWRDLENLWTRCDLVVCADGVEVGRVDLLNRSAYSAQQDFGTVDVDFTTRTQSFPIGDCRGKTISVSLDGAFWNEVIMTVPAKVFLIP